MLPGQVRLRLIKAGKDPLLMGFRYSGAVIAYRYPDIIRLSGDGDADLSTGWGKLDCVGDQIGQDKSECFPVGDDVVTLSWQIELNLVLFCLDQVAMFLDDLPDQGSQAKVGELELGLASVDILEVEHALHQAAQLQSRLQHMLQFLSPNVVFKHVDIAQDNCQRCP